MPQMTPEQARLYDPVLSDVVRGYRQAGYVWDVLFPAAAVDFRGGKYPEFGREEFSLYNSVRAPGASIQRVRTAYSASPYALEPHALAGTVTREEVEEARGPSIDLARRAIQLPQRALALRREYAAATLATDASKYPSANKVTLSGASQWSDPASNPIGAIATGRKAVRDAVGVEPTVLVLGAAVADALFEHPALVERIKYSQIGVTTEQLMAQLFRIDRVVIGKGWYVDAAGTQKDLWGKHAVLAYTTTSGLGDIYEPTYGYMLALRNYPYVGEGWMDNNSNSWVYPVFDDFSPIMCGPGAGYLFINAVA